MNIFMILVWVPVIGIVFQFLLWLYGEHAGDLNKKRREEMKQLLQMKSADSFSNQIEKIFYWLRWIFYAFYLWPLRVFIANLCLVILCVLMF